MINLLVLGLVGLCAGSFVNALVWRLKHKRDWVRERSVCTYCGHVLSATDLIPIISWLWLKGKCRYCHKPISWQYPAVELATALLFIWSYLVWPYGFNAQGLFLYSCWLLFLTGFMALIIYDIRWMTLPNAIVFPLIALAVMQTALTVVVFKGGLQSLLEALWGFLIVGGLFYALFQVSGGKWIGGGDVKLGMALGLVVGGPLHGLLLIFIASLLGTLVSLPQLAGKRLNVSRRIAFGPFLITAAIIVHLYGEILTNWWQVVLITG